jgi:glycerol-3-phosphate dehydrogenase
LADDNATVSTDVLVIGGGIAGLWLLARLRKAGYRALLAERQALGHGQTRFAQGIIHGGTKYALTGTVSDSARAVAAMPGRWRACLEGSGELDLSAVRLLASHQYLWSTAKLASRMAGFFAGQAMRSRVEPVEGEARPAVLRDAGFKGRVYRLDEPVLDVASLLDALIARSSDALLVADTVHLTDGEAPEVVLSTAGATLRVRARRVVLAAGEGNAELLAALGRQTPAMQRRPLHMVLVRGPLPDDLYAHCLGASATPRLTVTSHRDASGERVWYLGGDLAEQGAKRSRDEQITAARAELAELLPWVDLRDCQWATVQIDRAEPRQPAGRRPEGVFAEETDGVITVWPTKLALAPVLADRVLGLLGDARIAPAGAAESLPEWPHPARAPLPWQEELQWS